MLVLPGPAYLLAHQGGWDEVIFVLAPLVVFAVLLAVARRRVELDGDEAHEDEPDR